VELELGTVGDTSDEDEAAVVVDVHGVHVHCPCCGVELGGGAVGWTTWSGPNFIHCRGGLGAGAFFQSAIVVVGGAEGTL